MFNLCAFCINFQQLHHYCFHSGVGLEGKIACKAPVATRSSRRKRWLWRKCWLQGIAVVIWDLIYTKKILKAGLLINSWRFRHFGKHERCHEHFCREGNVGQINWWCWCQISMSQFLVLSGMFEAQVYKFLHSGVMQAMRVWIRLMSITLIFKEY